MFDLFRPGAEAVGAEVHSARGRAEALALITARLVAEGVADRDLDDARATGAPTVATDRPGCGMQIRGGFDTTGDPIDVRHTVELLEQALQLSRQRTRSHDITRDASP